MYVGNLDSRVTERDLKDKLSVFGVIRSVWGARRPPGYAFIDFDDHIDALMLFVNWMARMVGGLSFHTTLEEMVVLI